MAEPDPTVGDLVGEGDTTPPDAPPDPLDPDAPSNEPAKPEDIDGEQARAEVDVGPLTVGVESDLQTGASLTIGGRF